MNDLEKNVNSTPEPITLTWLDLTFEVKGKVILDGVSGQLGSGQLLAVMGPSGAGKSTFLDVLCKRAKASKGTILLDGSADFDMRRTVSFVEQDDALLGVLTVRETIAYAARLSLPRTDTASLDHQVDSTIRALGLQDVASNKIGTPLQRGISGGQKRRVTIACSVIARPRVLVLDEPTSGLDSQSAKEVMAAIKRLAHETNMICIATIHQPNWEVFSLFDRLTLLAGGRVMYNGRSANIDDYLTDIGRPTPRHGNPADQAIAVVNTDFQDQTAGVTPSEYLDNMAALWKKFASKYGVDADQNNGYEAGAISGGPMPRYHDHLRKTIILTQRNFLNYTRNLLAFGIRMGMYVGMGLMLATIWIRLGTSTDRINDRLSVFFFSVAFLGFMSVAGIPAFLEERAVFIRERSNGLYGPAAYVLANTIAVVPFLFACTLLFSLIAYWAIGLRSGAIPFFRFTLYLFLGVMAAESQSVLVAAIVPIFVAALAIAAFMNGFWMCVQGYFIKATSLPRFWYYWAHWIDFQTFAFQLITRNDVIGLTFQCPTVDGSCLCPFASSLTPAQCALTGDDIVKNLGYEGANDGLYVGILLIIILFYRMSMWIALAVRKR
ncbi:P-loop containing nucleoside triphosphate hydrolase protein [Athelia psychrophila]|uniref:P-loop containing nucleoside triphosphate hydrolase protein n=1 Tax=Athelia psychrophila TaxID=1759441 RepID=A0A166D6Z2_9AGAM|nr:P-loop containing nucleoside triphosphate hydrolase protein [Fibularhizoctonia sp. CBS 109695]